MGVIIKYLETDTQSHQRSQRCFINYECETSVVIRSGGGAPTEGGGFLSLILTHPVLRSHFRTSSLIPRAQMHLAFSSSTDGTRGPPLVTDLPTPHSKRSSVSEMEDNVEVMGLVGSGTFSLICRHQWRPSEFRNSELLPPHRNQPQLLG